MVKRDRLGLSGEGTVDVINVKCAPMLISSLRTKEGYHVAYHMNKDKWISIRLDGSVPEDEIKNLIDFSFGLTETKKKKPYWSGSFSTGKFIKWISQYKKIML